MYRCRVFPWCIGWDLPRTLHRNGVAFAIDAASQAVRVKPEFESAALALPDKRSVALACVEFHHIGHERTDLWLKRRKKRSTATLKTGSSSKKIMRRRIPERRRRNAFAWFLLGKRKTKKVPKAPLSRAGLGDLPSQEPRRPEGRLALLARWRELATPTVRFACLMRSQRG